MAGVCSGQGIPDVGSGAPSDAIRARFLQAYYRNGFAYLVATPPVSSVRKFGTTGLIQEFQDAAKTQNTRLALVKANTSDAIAEDAVDVFQVLATMYAYYNSIGVNTAGYPTNDTAKCPAIAGNACAWQLFDKNYALFVYEKATAAGDNFAIRDPFYTKWAALGAMNGLGPAAGAEQAVTSSTSAIAATSQAYQQGAVYNITSGVLNGRLVSVRQPVWDLYVQNGMHSGFLGLPTAEEIALTSGRRRQVFEGGAIEYDVGSSPVLRLPVASVVLNISILSYRLNLGDTLTVEAKAVAANGAELTDRSIIWTSSNTRAVQVLASGSTAILKAVGGGSTTVTASTEGKSSSVLSIFVVAPCCQIGEGAPTAAVQQAFQDAIARNRLNVRLPAAGPVRRAGGGLVQELAAADSSVNARYLVAMSDRTPVAYVVAGALLDKYEALGGPGGALGYPQADATGAGRQIFEYAALGGAPPRAVSGAILSRWAALGYEGGIAGLPAGDPSPFFTFMGTRGTSQVFTGGVFYGAAAGRVSFVTGLVLARYLTMNGPAGQLGMPVGDEFTLSGRRRQDFEGGRIEYSAGDAEASVTESERRPSVSASPAAVVAGSRVRLTIGGFDTGATLRVFMSGAPVGSPPEFTVKTQNGAYTWEAYLPASAQPGLVLIRAADVNGSAVAQGSYVVRTPAESRLTLSKTRGDTQTGAPGALLAQPLRVSLRDEAGNVMPGVAVRFESSPGGSIASASSITDERGEAEAWLRLPAAPGVALATAEAARQLVTFSARVAATALPNFPRLNQAAGGPLAAALASILRFHQGRGELSSQNGLADPATLGIFLTSFCTFDYQGQQLCDGLIRTVDSNEQIANPWRAAAFAGGGIEAVTESADLNTIRDSAGQGSPVLVALSLLADGSAPSAHFVVVIGVAANGTLVIHDPNPALGRANLTDYLAGFTAAGRTYQATITGAMRLLPRPAGSGFVVTASNAAVALEAESGACGASFEFPDASGKPVTFRYCRGADQIYQLDLTAPGAYRAAVTDLGSPPRRSELVGEAAGAFKITRQLSNWMAEPQAADLLPAGIVNAATLTSDFSPGTLIYLKGIGLGRAGGATAVEIGGMPAAVLAATPFQVTAQAPLDLAPGFAKLIVRSPLGAVERTIDVRDSAAGVIRLETGRAAIVNEGGALNTPLSPAKRGQRIVIYGTGFGAVDSDGAVTHPVSAVIQDIQIDADWTGLTTGFLGLYQVNLTIPVTLPPGLSLPLVLKQGTAVSPSVEISVE